MGRKRAVSLDDLELPPKQERFCREYLIDLSLFRAAQRAGYSDPNYGRQLIAKPNVAKAIRRLKDARAQRTAIMSDRVLEELAHIGFADMRDLFTWDEERAAYVPSRDLTPEQAAAIASVKAVTRKRKNDDGDEVLEEIRLELRTHDKLGALKEIGRHLGIATRHEHAGPDGGAIPLETKVVFVEADGADD